MIEDTANALANKLIESGFSALFNRTDLFETIKVALKTKDLVKEKIEEIKDKKPTSPVAYLSKALSSLPERTDKLEKRKPILIFGLLDEMREAGLIIWDEDFYAIDLYINYVYQNNLMDLDQLREWHHKAKEYLDKKPNATTKDYLKLYKKTRAMMALNIPYDELDEKIRKHNAEWEEFTARLKTAK